MAHIADYKLADRRIVRLIDEPDETIEDNRAARRSFRLPVYRELEQLGRIIATSMDVVFTLPGQPNPVVTDEAALIGFVADPQGVPEHLSFSISVNNTVILELSFSTRSRRALLEIVDGGLLRQGDNTIRFAVTIREAGTTEDAIEFSNIMLWFQRNL